MNKPIQYTLAFLAGAAVGATVIYLITREDENELAADFKTLAQKVKNSISEQLLDLENKKAQYEKAREQEDMMGV